MDAGGFGKKDRVQLFAICSHYVSSQGLVATFVQPSLCRVLDYIRSRAAGGLTAFPAVGDVHHDTSKALDFLDAGTRTRLCC
jgi:hypothetical protein